jgi:hypothetical protein
MYALVRISLNHFLKARVWIFDLTYFNISFLCQIRGSQLWGTDIYTDDSDIVAGMIRTKTFRLYTMPKLIVVPS